MTHIPDVLAERGAIFIPIDPGKKRPDRPRTDEYLLAADDDVMQAYLEADHNYGIACVGDLAVLDADDPEAMAPIIEELPETPWQTSGSRSSEHYFLDVPGLDGDIPLDDPRTGDHVGHIKGAPQSIVVGPSSRHPSGNRYGPLHDGHVDIATMPKAALRSLVAPYTRDDLKAAVRDVNAVSLAHNTRTTVEGIRVVGDDAIEPYLDPVGPIRPSTKTRSETSTTARKPRLDVYDVIDEASYPEGCHRGHPFHPSDTDSNFTVYDEGESWHCWRHDGGGYGAHLLGIEQDVVTCAEVARTNGRLDAQTWREIFDSARADGYNIPTPTESVKETTDVARCPGCNWALGEHRRDPFDPTAFWCDRCKESIPEDEAFDAGDGGVEG